MRRLGSAMSSVAQRWRWAATGFFGLNHLMEDRVRIEQELRLAQRRASVGQLAEGIAHEINTPIPLTAITCDSWPTPWLQLEPVYVALEAL
jgi:hypothetical protein